MKLTADQQGMLEGESGPALQWAMQFHHSVGEFFDAPDMVPISSAHFGPDSRMMGPVGQTLMDRLIAQGAGVSVPSYMDPCGVDFERLTQFVDEFNVPEDYVEAERRAANAARALGFLPTFTCINYQTISPPRFGEHLGWGDTGAAICANALFGARTNFEAGASALAAALTGSVPAYAMHLGDGRKGTLSVRIDAEPREISDWGAIAAWIGTLEPGYHTVPVIHGDFQPPGFNSLKQLGVALASYGSHAMFHLVGATPEAQSLEAAFQGQVPETEVVCDAAAIESIYDRHSLEIGDVDLVVFAAPQLAIDEVVEVVNRLGSRRVHQNTQLLLAVGPQVKAEADRAGLTEQLRNAGGNFLTGTCFYGEAPLLGPLNDWRSLVTNSTKLVNTLMPSGLEVAFEPLERCLEAAVTGRLNA